MLVTAAIATTVGTARAQSNIDPAHKFAWGENIGWTNWRDADATAQGVLVTVDFLSGFIWGENAGWINVGNGPTNGVSYANADGTDFGVNVAPNGDLSGFAWGENIGWVNFDTSSVAPDQARFDYVAARFRGFAWSENEGWLNLDDAEHFVGVLGACCNFNGTCTDGVAPTDCQAQGEIFNPAITCENVACEAIPTVSEWGLIVMTLIGCTAGTIIFARRQRAAG